MTTPKRGAALMLTAAFAVGIAVGGVSTAAWSSRQRVERLPPRDPEGYAAYLREEVGLSTTQEDSIRALLVRRVPAMDSLWGRIAPEMDSLRTSLRADIRARLDDAQQQRYEQLLARDDARRRRGRNGR